MTSACYDRAIGRISDDALFLAISHDSHPWPVQYSPAQVVIHPSDLAAKGRCPVLQTPAWFILWEGEG